MICPREACLSRFHFQYLTQRRLERARLWLADKDLSVSEICNDVGFESLGSFSILFKKESGYAPQYYRNQAWKKKQEALRQPRSFIPHCFIETCTASPEPLSH